MLLKLLSIPERIRRKMEIKLGNFNLQDWQNHYEDGSCHIRDIPIHTRVCPSNGLRSLGIVTDMDPIKQPKYHSQPNMLYTVNVTVLWLLGPNKGKSQVKLCRDLINYDAYKAAIMSQVAKLDSLEAEAAKAGL